MNTTNRSPRRREPTAAELVKARKAEAARLIAKLQAKIAAVPDDTKNYGFAGDLGFYVEQLAIMVDELG